MIFSRRNKGPMIASSCSHPALRALLLMGVFALTIAAYWWHFDRRMAEIAPPDGRYSVSDVDDVLTKAQEKHLYAWRSAFKDTWGIDLFVMVSKGALILPDFPGSTLFVGVGVEMNEALLVLPPLAKKALGEGVRVTTEEALAQCVGATPPEALNICLEKALQTLWDNF